MDSKETQIDCTVILAGVLNKTLHMHTWRAFPRRSALHQLGPYKAFGACMYTRQAYHEAIEQQIREVLPLQLGMAWELDQYKMVGLNFVCE